MFPWLPILFKALTISFQCASPLFSQYWRTSDSFLASVGFSLPMFFRICVGTSNWIPKSCQSTSFSSYTRSFSFGGQSMKKNDTNKLTNLIVLIAREFYSLPAMIDRRTAESAKRWWPLNPLITSPTPEIWMSCNCACALAPSLKCRAGIDVGEDTTGCTL